ncbi:MAG: hypothetical protein O7E57_00300 [Gammaproteobacteria bacterium]|nr:hypothetical protein [Gammaproteobacteria bacterium]
MAEKLNTGDTFPELNLSIAGGGSVRLPTDIETPYALVLFYRGHW